MSSDRGSRTPATAGHAPFAVLNRSVNRVLAALLRSPLRGLLDGRMMLITVIGRRSGRSHTLPVMYAREDETLRVTVGWPERKLWWRNLADGAGVQVLLRGERRTGHGRAHRGPQGEVTVEVGLAPRP